MDHASNPMQAGRKLHEIKSSGRPERHEDAVAAARAIIERCAGRVIIALPLGLGKPNTLINALTRAALADRTIELHILTALTLERPSMNSDMARRLMAPALDRLFACYPPLCYAERLHAGELPDNIRVSEFFLMAGRWTNVPHAQQNYISANYTHALRFLLAREPNVLGQLLATDGAGSFSLSCNTDISADLLQMRRDGRVDFLLAGEVNSELPFLGGVARCAPDEVDLLLENSRTDFELFSAVKQPVNDTNHAIGLHVAGLVRDGGTLQIGIGATGDAVAAALRLRHQQNETYRALQQHNPFADPDHPAEADRFETGLYACTEMLVDGLLRLFEAGVIRREVDGAAIHAGFFVDTRDFYRALHEMPAGQRARIAMMPVSFTNSLYGDRFASETVKRHARVAARFINNAMMVTVTGAVVSDGTGDGRVISGVGGQFDFVGQAFALDDARSVITLPATRRSAGRLQSNIVFNYPHHTVPRHLRDIVVTEYGVADLRGKSDEQTAIALIAIADSHFQDELLEQAKNAGKVARHATLAGRHRSNRPDAVTAWLAAHRCDDALADFPFGTDFTDVERRLLPALAILKENSGARIALARLFVQGVRTGRASPRHRQCLKRMQLWRPGSIREFASAMVLRGALAQASPDNR